MSDQERADFEADAAQYDFDLTRQRLAVPEPWSEYRDADTGHRWAGWLARADTEVGLSGVHLRDLMRWAYSKLHYREFGNPGDALMLDALKLELEHGQ